MSLSFFLAKRLPLAHEQLLIVYCVDSSFRNKYFLIYEIIGFFIYILVSC